MPGNDRFDIQNDRQMMQWRKEAEQEAKGKSLDQLQKEYQKINRSPGILSWIRDRANSLLNMIKIAAMSVFLGRQETAKRVEAGSRDTQREQEKNEQKTSVKKEVLVEKIKELSEKENQNPGKESNLLDETEKNSASKETEKGENTIDPTKEQTQEKAVEDEYLDYLTRNSEPGLDYEQADKLEPSNDHSKTNQTEPEKESVPEKNMTIFAQQLQKMTGEYQAGLGEFLSNITGINKDAIDINNVKDGIRIEFPLVKDDSQYAQGMTIGADGCSKENTALSNMLATAVLYYTAKEYREEKNQTQFPGTIPSRKMIKDQLEKLGSMTEKDGQAHSGRLFGHTLTTSIQKDGTITYSFDNNTKKPLDLEKNTVSEVHKDFSSAILGRNLALRYSIQLDNNDKVVHFHEMNCVKGDYGKIAEISSELHDITAKEVFDYLYVKYSLQDLELEFTKELTDFTKDNSGPTRGIDFHGHHIHMELNEQKEISAVIVDKTLVYGEIEGVSAEVKTGLINEDIAKLISLELEPDLERNEMFINHSIEQFYESPVSEIGESGELIQSQETTDLFEEHENLSEMNLTDENMEYLDQDMDMEADREY